jgi:3-oxoadipate CoA-transferase beta subunit
VSDAQTTGLSTDQIAREVALDLPSGSFVNLGVGIPQKVSSHVRDDMDITLHCENGILGLGPPAAAGEEDWDLVDAGKIPVTLALGGSYISHADSFAIIRGGHLDVCVLGGYQVSRHGDLANWNDGEDVPAVGGAMDLALGARTRIVMMRHTDKRGRAKLVPECTLPLTARHCVHRVYTDLGIFEPVDDHLKVLAIAAGVSLDYVRERTGIELDASGAEVVLPRAEGPVFEYGWMSSAQR